MKKPALLIIIFIISLSAFALPLPNVKATFRDNIPGEILVGFVDEVDEYLITSLGGSIVQEFTKINTVLVSVPIGSEDDFIDAILSNKKVKFAERNSYYTSFYTPSDPNYGNQWHYDRIRAPEAWDITKGSSSIIVAVVDTGIDYNHPDLNDNMWKDANGFYGYDFVNDDNDPMDDNGHGTHVAGTIAAEMDNNLGGTGVAPNVKLMAVKVLDTDGYGSWDDIARGIIYAADNGAHIINLSLGGYVYSGTLENAVNYAHSKGCLLIAAAGNDDRNEVAYPAKFPTVVAVSAIDYNNNPSKFGPGKGTNYGPEIELCAPGGGDLDGDRVLDSINEGVYSTEWDDTYSYLYWGTSMATPHVSGTAALLWSMRPDWSSGMIRALLRKTADDLGVKGWDQYYGFGRVNAYSALKELDESQFEMKPFSEGWNSGDEEEILLATAEWSSSVNSLQGTGTTYALAEAFIGGAARADAWFGLADEWVCPKTGLYEVYFVWSYDGVARKFDLPLPSGSFLGIFAKIKASFGDRESEMTIFQKESFIVGIPEEYVIAGSATLKLLVRLQSGETYRWYTTLTSWVAASAVGLPYPLPGAVAGGSISLNAKLDGVIIQPRTTNIDVVLVIDRSGSMGWDPAKINGAKTSAKLFVDLMKIGDRIGVVSYASTATVNFQLSEITSTATKIAAKNAIDPIYASGSTAMGLGLRTAYNQLVSYGDPSHPWAIILMSNGWHNTGEHPYNVIPDLKSRNIRVYTIGLGAGADAGLLGYIASKTGGFYRFAPSPEQLLEIYNDIAAQVTQAQTVASIKGSVAQGEITQSSVDIDSSIAQATFTLSWGGSDLDLILTRPDGSIIDPSIAQTDPSIEYVEEAQYELYRLDNPMAGTWTINVIGVDVPIGTENFIAKVTAITLVTLSVVTDKSAYSFPEPIKIMAILEEGGIPITGVHVRATVIRPDSSEVSFDLFDDGSDDHGDLTANDGIYTNYFLEFTEDGSYTIKVTAFGTTLAGQNFTREDQRTVLVSGVPIDTNPPKTTLLIGIPQYVNASGNVYVTSNTSIVLTAVDNNGAGSGVANTRYRIYNATYSTGWIMGVPPLSFKMVGLNDGEYKIDYYSIDNVGNVEPLNTVTVILDNTAPSIDIVNPPVGWALQDGVTFIISATDTGCGVSSVTLSLREADGGEGIPVGFEDMKAIYDSTTGKWTLFFDTLQLPDGYYVVVIKARDNLGNLKSTIHPYSIRNWAVLELLPASENNKAGRTMPVKFALRVAASVDPNQPFVYNEELTVKIYAADDPNNILQSSTFGDTARDYRINTIDEHYITNFKTLKKPKTYTVEIWRKDMLIGSFQFQTNK